LEAGVVKRIWETEFRAEPAHAQSAPTLIEPGDLPIRATSPAPAGPALSAMISMAWACSRQMWRIVEHDIPPLLTGVRKLLGTTPE